MIKKKSEFKANLFIISVIILKNNTFFHDNILSKFEFANFFYNSTLLYFYAV